MKHAARTVVRDEVNHDEALQVTVEIGEGDATRTTTTSTTTTPTTTDSNHHRHRDRQRSTMDVIDVQVVENTPFLGYHH